MYLFHNEYKWIQLWRYLPQIRMNRNDLVKRNNWCWFFVKEVSSNISINCFIFAASKSAFCMYPWKGKPQKALLLRDKSIEGRMKPCTAWNDKIGRKKKALYKPENYNLYSPLHCVYFVYHGLSYGKESKKPYKYLFKEK